MGKHGGKGKPDEGMLEASEFRARECSVAEAVGAGNYFVVEVQEPVAATGRVNERM